MRETPLRVGLRTFEVRSISRHRRAAGKSSIQNSTRARASGLPRQAKGTIFMTDQTSSSSDEASQNATLQKAVIVGIQPGQSPHVLQEAAQYATLFEVPLVVAHVDVTRFVTYEDPDGYVHSAPIDLNVDAGAAEFADVQAEAARVLADSDVAWTARQLV